MQSGDRVFLTYLGYSMELPKGDTIIGRGLTCQMRFNDPSVSREHARLQVEGRKVMVEDLGSRNGTQLNGRPLHRPTEVDDGDTLQIGARTLAIHILSDAKLADISTLAWRELPTDQPRAHVQHVPQVAQAQRCPECRAPVTVEDDFCRACGYTWADFRPGSVTQKFDIVPDDAVGIERRRHARHRVRVPVLYASDNLTVETLALNLSRSGVFVKTQILDEVGTRCNLTLMVDGAPALTFVGRVSRVVEREGGNQDPLGLGIEFINLDAPARKWLDDTLARLATG